MTDKELLARVEEYAKKLCEQYTQVPGLWAHTQMVRECALKLAGIEKADPLMVEIAALLHDIGKDNEHGRQDHAVRSHDRSEQYLKNIDWLLKKLNSG
ncbi:MAG: HDIG domain-containing protein [Dehalococcoidales bacterium]|nr:HDIG domain-containing protein [Dehalococcoidales bacterium]